MTSRIHIGDIDLLAYQQELVERLEPLLARLDDNMVTSRSGLTSQPAGTYWALELRVEASNSQMPGLWLQATPNQCILGFGGGEVVECHRDPDSAPDLVDTVVSLTERYLSGVTALDYFDRRGTKLSTEYFYGLDSETNPACKIGTSGVFAFFRRVTRTAKHTHRFLRVE